MKIKKMEIELKTESDMKSVFAVWRCPDCRVAVEYSYWDFLQRGRPVCFCETDMEPDIPDADKPYLSKAHQYPRNESPNDEGQDDQQMHAWNHQDRNEH